MSFLPFLHQAAGGSHLSADEADAAMSIILGGGVSTAQLAAFLVALRMKGETADEVYGFARAMRRMAARVDAGTSRYRVLDTCGTGGDRAGTFNISTVAAFVVAGAGVKVAKHGNRSISSQCGSADLLERMGVAVSMDAERAGRAIREIGIGFLFAPAMHPAMKHAQPARLELKMRTVFNLLGPLTNPAGATAQIVGAPSPGAAALMAEALARLGLERGFVVHGADGLDEITTTGPTSIWEVAAGRVTTSQVTPDALGVKTASPGDLRGGDAARNREIADEVLEGAPGPRRDVVIVNAAAGLVAAGAARDFREGMTLAARSIDSGAARAKVGELAQFSRSG